MLDFLCDDERFLFGTISTGEGDSLLARNGDAFDLFVQLVHQEAILDLFFFFLRNSTEDSNIVSIILGVIDPHKPAKLSLDHEIPFIHDSKDHRRFHRHGGVGRNFHHAFSDFFHLYILQVSNTSNKAVLAG